jgi:YVTN family beta-propeller protein
MKKHPPRNPPGFFTRAALVSAVAGLRILRQFIPGLRAGRIATAATPAFLLAFCLGLAPALPARAAITGTDGSASGIAAYINDYIGYVTSTASDSGILAAGSLFADVTGTAAGGTVAIGSTLIACGTAALPALAFPINSNVDVLWSGYTEGVRPIELSGSGRFTLAAGRIAGLDTSYDSAVDVLVCGGAISSADDYHFAINNGDTGDITVTGGLVGSGTGWGGAIASWNRNGWDAAARITVTGGAVLAAGTGRYNAAIFTGSSYGIAVAVTGGTVANFGGGTVIESGENGLATYLAGTVTGSVTANVANNAVVEVSTLAIPKSWGGTDHGLTIVTTGGTTACTVAWDTSGTVPLLVASNSLSIAWGVLVDDPGAAPVIITATVAVTGTVGDALSYQVAATNNPDTYAASGLPSGLVINGSTGFISGIPTASGTFDAGVAATNAYGTGSASLYFLIAGSGTVPSGAIPAITPAALTLTGTVGKTFSHQIAATNRPTSYAGAGLPSGLAINRLTGLVSGTPAVSGTFVAALTAANVYGSGTASRTLVIAAITSGTGGGGAVVALPEITSALGVTGTVGQPLAYQLAATGTPTAYATATGSALPPGFALNASTGLVSGTPSAAGVFETAFRAANSAGAGAAAEVTFTIAPATPAAYPVHPAGGHDAAPAVMIYDHAGNMYVSDPAYGRVMRIAPGGWLITHDFVTGLAQPSGLALDLSGLAIYIADTGHGRVLKVTLSAIPEAGPAAIETIATGLPGPCGLAAGYYGTVFVFCTGDNRVYMLTPPPFGAASAAAPRALAAAASGVVSPQAQPPSAATTAGYTLELLAGGAAPGSADGIGTDAAFDTPTGLAYNDATGLLYVADTGNSTIREINVATKKVTTIAGAAGQHSLGDGDGAAARLNTPEALTLDSAGLLYIADTGNNAVRVLDPVTKAVSTVVTAGAADGALDLPAGIAINPAGEVTVVDTNQAAPFRTLAAAPAFVAPPADRAITENTNVTLDATAWGSPAPAYEWRKNGALLAGGTAAIRELAPARQADAGNYAVRAFNAAGNTQAAFTLTVTATGGSTTGGNSDGGNTGGGGGGGGGAPSPWFVIALAVLGLLRLRRKNKAG